MDADAHPVCRLFVFACVHGLLADRLWINHDKFFDLLLARTGCNGDQKAECCQKFDALRHLYLLSLVLRDGSVKPAIFPAMIKSRAHAPPTGILPVWRETGYVDKSVDKFCDSLDAEPMSHEG